MKSVKDSFTKTFIPDSNERNRKNIESNLNPFFMQMIIPTRPPTMNDYRMT